MCLKRERRDRGSAALLRVLRAFVVKNAAILRLFGALTRPAALRRTIEAGISDRPDTSRAKKR